MVRVIALRGLKSLRDGQEQAGMPEHPVTLMGSHQAGENGFSSCPFVHGAVIHTRINGKEYAFPPAFEKSLLLPAARRRRADWHEGRLRRRRVRAPARSSPDGMAVMSCLRAAPRADGRRNRDGG